MKLRLRTPDDVVSFEANVIDSVVDSDSSWENPRDSANRGRRLKLVDNARIPTLLGPMSSLIETEDLEAEVFSHYLYWQKQMEQAMTSFRHRWMRTENKVRWYELLSRNKLAPEMNNLARRISMRGERVKLAQDLIEVYVSLLNGNASSDLLLALRKLGLILPSVGSVVTLEDVLRTYDPPNSSSPTRAAADNVIAVLQENGYDRALDLIRSLKLPEFLSLTSREMAYEDDFATKVLRVTSKLPTENVADRDPVVFDTVDADDVEDLVTQDTE